MAVLFSPESDYAKEMRKHESTHTQWGPPGRVLVAQEYPKRLYKAGRNDSGQPVIVDADTALSEADARHLQSRGFVTGGQAAAIEALHAADTEMAKLAAERAHTERSMSAKAQAEAAAADAATMDHVPEVASKPIRRRRGRQPKVKVDATHE